MVPADSGRISPVPPYSGYRSILSIYTYGAITRYGSTFQKIQFDDNTYIRSYNPPAARCQSLGFFLFARHYSGNHDCFLFLLVLRCFSSQGWLPVARIMPLHGIGLSHSEICGYNACVQLPAAYRSLPRPSSPLRAKASTIRP